MATTSLTSTSTAMRGTWCVGNKAITKRVAVTEGLILMEVATLQKIIDGDNKKGDVLGIARIAGTMATKKPLS